MDRQVTFFNTFGGLEVWELGWDEMRLWVGGVVGVGGVGVWINEITEIRIEEMKSSSV